MKRIISVVSLAVLVSCSALAEPAPIWENYGTYTVPPVIDAYAFHNHGMMSFGNTGSSGGYGYGYGYGYSDGIIFDTQNTLNFTNQGTMSGSLGFRFDNVRQVSPNSSTWTRVPAANFVNLGNISGLDNGGLAYGYGSSSYAGTSSNLFYSVSTDVVASKLQVYATNIYNTGVMSVGELGIMQLAGDNVDLRRGALVAGTLVDDYESSISYGGWYNGYSATGRGFTIGTNWGVAYINPVSVTDLFWGAGTNTMNLERYFSILDRYFYTPYAIAGWRGGYSSTVSLPMTYPFDYAVYANTNFNGSNYYVNIVLVKTNGLNTNMVVEVGFTDYSIYYGSIETNLTYVQEAVVRFGVRGEDIVTGNQVTNACYLIDSGAMQDSIYLLTNYNNRNTLYTGTYDYQRPSSFEITTTTPWEWYFSYPANATYTPEMIWPGNTFTNSIVEYNYGVYGAQIGRDPENLNGLLSDGYAFNSTNYYSYYYYTNGIVLGDVTNEVGRIEVDAGRLDLSHARIRAEGLLTLKAKELVHNAPAIMDAGSFSCDLANPNGYLNISNLFPTSHARISGNIYAWCANWKNQEITATATNDFRFHVLVVDHALVGNALPSIHKMALRATNVYVQDQLRVVRPYIFETENLTLNGPVTVQEQAPDFVCANVPKLKTFLNDTNGNLTVTSRLCLGQDRLDTTYGLVSLINRGSIGASTMQLKSTTVENSGSITISNSGSCEIIGDLVNFTTNNSYSLQVDPITLETNLAPTRSHLLVDSDTFIIANTFRAQHSVLSNGIKGAITFKVKSELSDMVPGVPGTGNVLNNFWEVHNGMSIPVKPILGDLFGTRITTVSSNYNYCPHIWPGEDRGATVSGFTNNLVIGRLVLDRQMATSRLSFAGARAGLKNAMYVDFLEFAGLALTDYFDNALNIDSNLTIYFADSNVDPKKLEQSYPGRLVWVGEFIGPNSAVAVPVLVGGQMKTIYANRSLAQSKDVDSDLDGTYNRYDAYPFDNIVLTVNQIGHGRVYPNLNLTPLVLGQNYTVTAKPARGSAFVGWTGAVTSSVPTINFTMQPNMVLNANFVTNAAFLPVTLLGGGVGAFSPDLFTNMFLFGANYKVTALPSPNNVFAGWRLTSGASNSIISSSPTLSFNMQPDLSVEATFITNNLKNAQGSYSGLFFNTNGANIESSGAFTFSLTEKGSSSGKLTMPSGSYSFKPLFNQAGQGSITVKRSTSETLKFDLQLDVLNHSDTITGTVVATKAGTQVWTATLLANRSTFNLKTNPAQLAGNYTMAILGQPYLTNAPGGDGFGLLSISKAGAVKINGSLADNISLTPGAIQSVPVSKTGLWPFYASFGRKEVILGWLAFDDDMISGSLHWVKTPNYGTYYKNGFTNDVVEVIGSRYTVPAKGVCPLDIVNPLVSLSGGNLATPLSWPVAYQPITSTFAFVDNTMKLAISPTTGKFKFTVVNSGWKNVPFNGVVLQRQSIARGYFLGDSQSGQILLEGE